MRKAVLWVLVGVFLASIGFGASLVSLRDRRWAAMEIRLDALSRELRDAPGLPRLSLGRPTLPGNAWDDYLAAAPGRPGITDGKIAVWLQRSPNADAAEALSLISEFPESVEHLQKGVRRETAKSPSPELARGIGNVVLLSVGKARLLAEAGHLAEALDLLVDVCLYSRDLASIPWYASMGIHSMGTAMHEIRDLLQRRELPSASLGRLAEALRQLDEGFPSPRNDLKADLLALGTTLRDEDTAGRELVTFSNPDPGRRQWRTLFSTRLQAAATFSNAESIVHRLLALEDQRWSLAYPELQQISKEINHSKDPFIRWKLTHYGALQWATETRGLLRLLRAATGFLATDVKPEIEDPVGGRIRSRVDHDSMLFWRGRWSGPDLEWEPKGGDLSYEYTLTISVHKR